MAATFDVINPATEGVAGTAPICTPAELDQAMTSAQRAFADWSRDEDLRRDAMRTASQALMTAAQDIGPMLTSENGKPLPRAIEEVWGCARDALTAALHRVHVLLAAYQVGGSQAVFERSLDYSSVRKQFGQPIGRFQRVQDHVVDLLNAVDSARWTAYDAIWRIDTAQDAAATAHLAKAVASESYLTATDEAHKVHGGIGVDPQYGLTLYTQLARTLYDFMGDPRWHKRRMTDALVGVPLSVEA